MLRIRKLANTRTRKTSRRFYHRHYTHSIHDSDIVRILTKLDQTNRDLFEPSIFYGDLTVNPERMQCAVSLHNKLNKLDQKNGQPKAVVLASSQNDQEKKTHPFITILLLRRRIETHYRGYISRIVGNTYENLSTAVLYEFSINYLDIYNNKNDFSLGLTFDKMDKYPFIIPFVREILKEIGLTKDKLKEKNRETGHRILDRAVEYFVGCLLFSYGVEQ